MNTPITSTVISSGIADGVLSVVVQFTASDGTVVSTDTFQTSQGQDDSWLTDLISARIEVLSSLNALATNISPGILDAAPQAQASRLKDSTLSVQDQSLNAKDQYAANLALFDKYVSAMAKGIIDQKNPDFLALKATLASTFSPDYLDLF